MLNISECRYLRTKREKNRLYMENKRTTKQVHFDVGDFVLYADVLILATQSLSSI